jgi:hypothetical protein
LAFIGGHILRPKKGRERNKSQVDEAERTERAPQQCLNKGRTGRRSNETKETNHTRKEGGNTTMCVPKSQIDVCAVKCRRARRNKMKVIGVLPVGWAPLTPSDLKDGHKMKQNEQFGCFGGKNLRVKSFLGVKLGWEQFEQKHIHTLYIR